ncbi:hypothetical protein ACEWY4_009525 [Coilia grayii]|uniref:Synaptotagmin-like protein 2 n=1 Tax=Coilia grayii TaxID=363190 RepID=A0ABD1K6N9_9TELE
MIDLSHLSEEEQEKIMEVLKRDAELKRRETMRVKQLQKTVRDKNKLKYMTGEWFYETKSRRHSDRIHGCDIIRASIRQRKPITIFELSKIWAESSGNTDLNSVSEEPPTESQNQRDSVCTPENQSDVPKQAAQPQAKQRQNPFNDTPASPAFGEETSTSRVSNGTAHADKTPAGELLPCLESPIATLTNQSSGNSENSQASADMPKPVPRKRVLHVSPNSSVDSNEPACKLSLTPSPKSILKQHSRNSSSNFLAAHSTHSLNAEQQSDLPDSPSSGSSSLDRKQVQFYGAVRGRNTARQDSGELSENHFLDQDPTAASDGEGPTDEGSDTSSSSSSDDDVDGSSEGHSSSREDSPIFPDIPQRAESGLSAHSKSSPKSSDLLNSKPLNGEEVKPGDNVMPVNFTGYRESLAESPASKVSSLHATGTDTGKTSEQWPGTPSPKPTEEAGHSFAKVLDWFSQSAGRSQKSAMRRDMEEASRADDERACRIESKPSGETGSSECKRTPNPSPKTRKGLLSFFSRADAKEPSSTMTPPAKDDVSQSTEDKEAKGQNVSLTQSKREATSTVEDTESQQEGPGISHVHSGSQSTLCNVKESSDQIELASSADLKSVSGAEDQDPSILKSTEGAHASSQEDQCADGQESDIAKAEQNVILEKSAKVSEAPRQKERRRYLHYDHSTQSMGDFPSEKTPEDEQHAQPKHGQSGLSVKPSCEGENSPSDSTSSVTSENSQSSSQGTDSSDVHQEPTSPVHSPTLSTKREQGKHVYTPPLKLSQSQQQDKAILVRNLRDMWEEEKRKLNLSVMKAKGDSDIKSDRSRVASPRGSRKSQHDRGARSTSLNRENATYTVEGTRRKSVAEIKIHSQWIGDTKQSFTLQNTKKQSSPTKTKSVCPTNPNQSVNLGTDNSSPRTQKKIKVNPMANRQEKGQGKAPSPTEQSKIPRRTSYKTSLDGSPLKTVPIDIGAVESDGGTSEDLSTFSVKHTRTPSPVERELHLEPFHRSAKKDKNGAGFQTKKDRPEPKSASTWIEQAQQREACTPPQSPTKSVKQLAKRSSSGNFQGSLKISLQVSPVHVRVQKHHGSPSRHARRTASGERSGNTSKNIEQDVTMAIEVLPAQPAESFASSGDEHYPASPEQMHVPVCSDRSGTESQTEEFSTQEEPVDERSSNSSPSHYTMALTDLGSSRGSTPEPWSYSSSACNSQNTTPVRGILKRPASRPMSFSKSMEDITTMPPREERKKSDQRSDLMLSLDDGSPAPSSPSSTLDPEQTRRMSASVPAFLENDDRDSDCTSENSMNSPHRQMWRLSSPTNNNSMSGMSSVPSSVSGSFVSIYSVDYGNVEVKGTIQFAMNYVEKLGEFHIFVVQCRDLAVAEPKRNRSDPYVKCYLLPDKAKLGKRKTSVKKKTLNPTFNEILRYKIPCDILKSTTLNLSVWHNDNFGRNSFLGEVDVDLSEWSITDTQIKHYLLRPRVVTHPSTEDQRGDIKVAVRFLPKVTQSKRASKSGELQIWVKECKNLPVVRGAIIDPFVKCTVLPDSSKKSRQKTRVAKKTADPVFNHTMVYDGFRPEDLCEICVELTVWDHDRLSNHFLGGIRLGLGTGKSYGSDVDWMDSTSEEAALWNQMMISQGEWVEDVFPLRMLMMARSMTK